MKLYVVGVGMGNPETLTMEARDAIAQSQLIIGAQRLLAPYRDNCACLELVKADEIVTALKDSDAAVASVLMSGDTGFYSGTSGLVDKLKAADFEVKVIPGISSLSYFCAKLQVPWQDVRILSAHGRACNVCGEVRTNAKTFLLTGGKTKVADICGLLAEDGLGHLTVHVGERLSYSDESIVTGSAGDLTGEEFSDLAVMLVENPQPQVRRFQAPALGDDDFIRGDVPMTKEEVRALAIAKLHIAPESTVWDIGAGTGSVSVEAALAALKGRVYSVERKPEAVELLKQNKASFNLSNMTVVEGEAVEMLGQLPQPDCVFLGGATGCMEAVLQAARGDRDVRVVATGVSLEMLREALDLEKLDFVSNFQIIQVSVSRSKALGDHHMMFASNPIYIASMDVLRGQIDSYEVEGA